VDLAKLLRQQWDRLAAIVAVAVGAFAVLLGWLGVSGHAYLANQLPYLISGGIGGLFLLGIGATLWISSDLRDEWQKLDRVERALEATRDAFVLHGLTQDSSARLERDLQDEPTAVSR
jgi:hypothetical protein